MNREHARAEKNKQLDAVIEKSGKLADWAIEAEQKWAWNRYADKLEKILDDFESRTCENCKYFDNGLCDEVTYSDHGTPFLVVDKNFGCNLFEPKE